MTSLLDPPDRSTGPRRTDRRAVLARVLREATYEVLPFPSAGDKVLAHVPTGTGLSVTTTEAKGLGPTVDLAVRLTGHGYRVAPHIAARLVRDRAHLTDLADRLTEAGISTVFVIGGDAAEPAGAYPDALALLTDLRAIAGDRFDHIGIGGYPEGHGGIADELIEGALTAKAPYATQIVTQLCFDPSATVRWARRIATAGVRLPIRVGVPGAVSRQKLIRVSAGLGLGQSARFLRKQQGMLWRFFTPGGYRPDRVLDGIVPALAAGDTGLAGIHVFTFNDLESTETWRRRLLERLDR
ncbi:MULTISPECIES: methylenetetrahydrofolate reductase [Pseudonocardia]|uniref:Methylenetetrahydrofolate reductase n=2 Tax=Pseudonocardia TaxID=1847 RepID=A0A1Y2MY85_PSEAH|nr:methylenetetrahydrofolate reductase [Pseudonocardia saturnea]OSY40170.1 Methylenetetrahydrofolate reductase [Pseudonocardia autotrophica]TDN72886.1 5,10-methylenetetrahydrofolate reductase [Pseudonocardia autotrophica]BBG03604.1 methylenetetrahydrofolate reductase [Pseudonocardia autotrophica]GEC29758.1 methylenetetrahydrofolate reductase [Pseudonocardia saturnea]